MSTLNTVVVAARKGGVGKSTTVRNLACATVRQGALTGIVDCDPQGTTTFWWNSRAAEDIVLYGFSGMKSLRQMQRELSGRGGWLWVDTPPSTHGFMEDLLRAADLVLVPMTGSPDDVEASLATLELAQQVGRPTLVVFNRVRRPPNSIFRELYEHLAREHRVAKAFIPDKVVVLEGRFRGTGVVEDDPQDMGKIYLGLLGEIEACLESDKVVQGAA